jgi:vancomycin resistance protein YoaR
MAAVNDVLVPPAEVAVEHRRRIWPRVAFGFVLGFVLALAFAGAGLYAFDAAHEGRVLDGVRVGDVDLSGLDHDQAVAALGSAYAGYSDGRIVVRTPAGSVDVPYAAFGRGPDVEAMVSAAMDEGRTGTPFERAVGEVRLALDGVTLAPRVTLDPAALQTAVRTALAGLRREAVDSRVLLIKGGWYAIPSLPGTSYDATEPASAALAVVDDPDAPAEVVVQAPAIEIAPVHGDADAIAATTLADRMVAEVVVTHGKKHWTIQRAVVRSWIRFAANADGSVTPTIDPKAVGSSLTKVSKGVALDALSATYLRNGRGRIVGVAAAKDGRKLDATATAASIANALTARAQAGASAAVAPVAAVTAPVAPKVTTAMAMQKGPLMVRLGTWKTWFPVSERNFFGANIWQPAKIIDGTVLAPGQRFEWWSALGPVTPARGFGPGGFIAGNHTEPTGALGGGMCSSSTTLFNAALRAGLQMGARSNHKYYISRYPLGLDATVSKTPGGGGQTVSFTNDMATPIVIRTYRYRAGGKGWVRYEIWGIPDGRTVSISRPSVSNLRRAVTNTIYVSTLEPGEREQTEYPANGMDVSVSRVVRDRSGRVIHSDSYGSHYILWNGVIQIGR